MEQAKISVFELEMQGYRSFARVAQLEQAKITVFELEVQRYRSFVRSRRSETVERF